jgi:hypothetical protein
MTLTERYSGLKARVVERTDEFDSFIAMLESETSWLTSPASTRFHLNNEQGLLQHSVAVATTLLTMRDCLAPALSDESCVIVGLFHDVGKVGMPGKPLYLRNTNQWEVTHRNIAYKTSLELPYMGQAARSLYLVGKYIPLSNAEAQAILYHDGQYIDDNHCVAHKEEPLTLLLHWADYWTAHIFEEGRNLTEDTARYARKGPRIP